MIEIKNLTKTYGKTKALDDLSLNINNGEVFGLLGHNGAGKSTLIKILVSIIDPDNGTVTIDDLDLKTHREEIKRKIGYVSDSPDLFLKLTIGEYWDFIGKVFDIGEDQYNDRLYQLMDIFQLTEQSSTIESLSHGMRQKVFIIGALLSDPDIWILDEPMTGLDPQASFNLKEMIKDRKDLGGTVIFSTHMLSVAEELCDRIAVLRHGKLIFLGTMDDLRSKYPGQNLEYIYLDMIEAYE